MFLSRLLASQKLFMLSVYPLCTPHSYQIEFLLIPHHSVRNDVLQWGCMSRMYGSRVFHLAALLTAFVDVQLIYLPFLHNRGYLTISCIPDFSKYLEALRCNVLICTILCSNRESIWNRERSRNTVIIKICSKLGNLKVKRTVIQCWAKVSSTAFLKWLT